MKRAALFLCALAILGVGQVWAEPLTKAERDRLVDHLKKTEKALKEATKGLSPAQWIFKQAPDRWSVAECVEHLALSEDALLSLVTDRVMKTPAAPEKKDAAAQKSKEEIS